MGNGSGKASSTATSSHEVRASHSAKSLRVNAQSTKLSKRPQSIAMMPAPTHVGGGRPPLGGETEPALFHTGSRPSSLQVRSSGTSTPPTSLMSPRRSKPKMSSEEPNTEIPLRPSSMGMRPEDAATPVRTGSSLGLTKSTRAKVGPEVATPSKKLRKTPSGLQQPKAVTSDPAPTTTTPPRERLLSCPDEVHHTESDMLERIARAFESKIKGSASVVELVKEKQVSTRFVCFEGKNAPKITVGAYVERLLFYLGSIAEAERSSGVDKAVHSDLAVRYLVATLILLERFSAKTGVEITTRNVHRLLITGTILAAKLLDDIQPRQKYFADLGGIGVTELASLEWAFAEGVDYSLTISPEEFNARYMELLSMPVSRRGSVAQQDPAQPAAVSA